MKESVRIYSPPNHFFYYLGSATENSAVPNILNHLLTKPEMREEDFFLQDIYSSPKFKLDSSRCHESVFHIFFDL